MITEIINFFSNLTNNDAIVIILILILLQLGKVPVVQFLIVIVGAVILFLAFFIFIVP